MAHAKCRNQMVLANTESRIICRIRVHTLQRSNGATHNKRIITIQTKFIRLLCDIIASFCGFGERFVATFCGRSVKLFSAASIWLQFGWNLSRMKKLEMKRFVCTSHGHGRACNMHDGDMTKCRERERELLSWKWKSQRSINRGHGSNAKRLQLFLLRSLHSCARMHACE